MHVPLTVIVTWVSINFGLPAAPELPHVEFASAAKMMEVRYSRLAPDRPDGVAAEAGRSAAAETDRDARVKTSLSVLKAGCFIAPTNRKSGRSYL